eukprot:3500734-Pleurochrysis_carterae.AAC.1
MSGGRSAAGSLLAWIHRGSVCKKVGRGAEEREKVRWGTEDRENLVEGESGEGLQREGVDRGTCEGTEHQHTAG